MRTLSSARTALRRYRTRPGREHGQAMIIFIGLLVIMTLLPSVMATQIAGQLPTSALTRKALEALAAANGGVSDYLSHLAADPSYVRYNDATGYTGSANPAFSSWVALGSSSRHIHECYRYSIIPPASPSESPVFHLLSTGAAGPDSCAALGSYPPGGEVIRTVSVGLVERSYLDYAWFSASSFVDNARYNCAASQASASQATADVVAYGYLIDWAGDLGLYCEGPPPSSPVNDYTIAQAARRMAQWRCAYSGFQANASKGVIDEVEGNGADSLADEFAGAEDPSEADPDEAQSAPGTLQPFDQGVTPGYTTAYGPDLDDCRFELLTDASTVHRNTLDLNTIDGPLYFGDALYVCAASTGESGGGGNVVFPQPVVDVGEPRDVPPGAPAVSGGGVYSPQTQDVGYNCTGGTNASFQPGAKQIVTPRTLPSMAPIAAAARSGGWVCTGPTAITISPGGSLDVSNPDPANNPSTCPVGNNEKPPANGVIFVRDDTSPALTITPGSPPGNPPFSRATYLDSVGTDYCTSSAYPGSEWQSPVQGGASANGYSPRYESPPGLAPTPSYYDPWGFGDTCASGDAVVSGDLGAGEHLTIAAEQNVVVSGSILYYGSGCQPVVTSACHDALGLVANDYVEVNNPVTPPTFTSCDALFIAAGSCLTSGNAYDTNTSTVDTEVGEADSAPETPFGSPGSGGNVTIDAAIMAINHGLALMNYGWGSGKIDTFLGIPTGYSCNPPLGTLTVNGSVIERYEEPLGEQRPAATADATLQAAGAPNCPSGFSAIDVRWTPSLLSSPPPQFPTPPPGASGSLWKPVGFSVVKPAY